jgi:phospholipid/cholesterol/gamma-HCH transport system permease protein
VTDDKDPAPAPAPGDGKPSKPAAPGFVARVLRRPFIAVGEPIMAGVVETGRLALFVGEFLFWLPRRPFRWSELFRHMRDVGFGSLFIVVLTGFFTGAVLVLQTGITLDQFGARPFVGRIVSATMVKELGPVLTGLMLAGRIGSGIAAELGSMVVTDQINALRALGTDPIRKLVVSRVLAGFFMAPVLTVIADTVGIIGGWIMAVFQLRVASSLYWTSVTEGLYLQDAWMGLIKPFCLGYVIVTIGCHVGLRTKGGTQGVGRATTNAVVASSVAVIAVDFFVTRLLITLLY